MDRARFYGGTEFSANPPPVLMKIDANLHFCFSRPNKQFSVVDEEPTAKGQGRAPWPDDSAGFGCHQPTTHQGWPVLSSLNPERRELVFRVPGRKPRPECIAKGPKQLLKPGSGRGGSSRQSDVLQHLFIERCRSDRPPRSTGHGPRPRPAYREFAAPAPTQPRNDAVRAPQFPPAARSVPFVRSALLTR